ncbi:replication-relaxation family protein [Streptomyces sp. NPDC050315]|uniref:replication-relaxation family protein n=1 Tax=Streptomyces sp. NPDC050315 TaxID=3155039 RepID=UPI00341C3BDC
MPNAPEPQPPYVRRTVRLHPQPEPARRTQRRPGDLAARLTDRDWWLLAMLCEHRVLTSHHLTALAFPGHRTALRRLHTLTTYGLLDSFRPWLPPGAGSAPDHYLLARTGAELLATRHNLPLKDIDWSPHHLEATAYSPRLAHTLGTNTVMTALTAHARHHLHHALLAWWSERSAARTWGTWARPDAYARWHDGTTTCDFFLEYDTGKEQLARVAAKLTHYARLTTATGITTPVLFHLPTATRETNVRTALAHAAARLNPPVPAATTHPGAGHPATHAWLPIGTDSPRCTITELAPPPSTGPAPETTTESAPGPAEAPPRWTPPPPIPPAVPRWPQ